MLLLGLLFPCAMIKDSLRFYRRINDIHRDAVRLMNIHEATSAIDDAPDRLPSIIYNRAQRSSTLMNPAVFMTFPKIRPVPKRYLPASCLRK